MALRLSTALRSFILQHGSMRDFVQNGRILLYSSTQPVNADAAPNGTLLATFTASSLAHTAEVLATGTVTLSGASGSVDTLTVDGVSIMDKAVPFNGSLTQTATDVATEINRALSSPDYRASASGAVVTIEAKRGSGASPNTFVVSGSLTTMTAVYVDMASGVDPVNGLRMVDAAGGKLIKDPSQNWTGVAGASGTAGWFRVLGSVADSGAVDSTESQLRMDGQVGTTGAELNLSALSVQTGATQTLTGFELNLPAS